MGELLRRYWWPIGISEHLKEKPTYIRVMGEDLVLYRDATGMAAVIGAKCAHRRANLCLGNVERDGIRCRYHGWLYGNWDANAWLHDPEIDRRRRRRHARQHGGDRRSGK